MHDAHATKLRVKDTPKQQWTTAAGSFNTTARTRVLMKLPELQRSRLIDFPVYLTDRPMGYDMIVGRDLLAELGIVLDFQQQVIQWDESEISMKEHDCKIATHFHVNDSTSMHDATTRLKKILDAKYTKANLKAEVDKCTHLNEEERKQLLSMLKEHEDLFDGTLGAWRSEKYRIELKPDAQPYHAKPFPVPKAHEAQLRTEVERLCKVGVLKKVNRSEWAAPTFIIPKKDGTVRFISDFRELNKRIKRKPFPIPKIHDLMLKLEGFQYATSLDLNMGYYHIQLDPTSRQLCTIVLPWGKYEYCRLPMGLCNSPDIFQEKMSELFADLEYVRAYIDDCLVITKGNYKDHLEKVSTVLSRLRKAGLKVNIGKSFFARGELEYLGYWITREGIMPLAKKVEAIQNIAAPKTKRQVRSFVGLVNYYRDMWPRRSDVIAPLSKLCSKPAKFEWKEEQQKAFEEMKRLASKETLLAYPDFNETFDIHTDASHTQLGAVISQRGKPIAFYSRKLNSAQTRYTTTERELLAIVETLKEFRNILLGQKIRVYTDHKNLTYEQFNTERVMRWRLILEEYGPELIYIKGENNVPADALSRLDMEATAADLQSESFQVALESQAECFGQTKKDNPDDAYPYPFSYRDLKRAQLTERERLLNLAKKDRRFTIKTFRGGDKDHTLICRNGKIVIVDANRERIMTWYHDILCHPGENRTEQTIRQHFWWPTLTQDVKRKCKHCSICQRTKRLAKKYGKLPEKEAEAIPWDRLCVDLIGPYELEGHTLWCITMIDPATSWFEIREIPNKRADTIANVVEQNWLTRYPAPIIITYDRGNEFMAEFAEMIKKEYGIKSKPITKRNPQANAIIERVHQTLGNMIRAHQPQLRELDEDDPWGGMLSAITFAIRSTFHTTLQATPMQLVFGRDAILNTQFQANWNHIKERKQKIIRKNNQRENAGRIDHTYQINDKVLMKNPKHRSKYGSDPWIGPYVVVKVNDNGTLKIKKGCVTDTINIRQLKPYHE